MLRPPYAQPSHRSAFCALVLVAALLTTLAACDSLDTAEHSPSSTMEASLNAART